MSKKGYVIKVILVILSALIAAVNVIEENSQTFYSISDMDDPLNDI